MLRDCGRRNPHSGDVRQLLSRRWFACIAWLQSFAQLRHFRFVGSRNPFRLNFHYLGHRLEGFWYDVRLFTLFTELGDVSLCIYGRFKYARVIQVIKHHPANDRLALCDDFQQIVAKGEEFLFPD